MRNDGIWTYWCAICKSKLVYLTHTDTIWKCDNCLQYYDTKIQDRPVKDKSEFKLKSYHDPYRQFDEDDPNIVFVEGIILLLTEGSNIFELKGLQRKHFQLRMR